MSAATAIENLKNRSNKPSPFTQTAITELSPIQLTTSAAVRMSARTLAM